ncbi:MAG: LysM peptidoglycan-binding domain-containing protein [Acidobacteriota bacterium]
MPNDPKKPDFSDVVSGSSSTAASPAGSPAFSDVVSGSSSTAPSPAGSSADPTTSRMYVVQAGDSLSKIAKKFYGNANSWKRIFEANKDVIKNPDLIQPGWKLQIPD